MVNFNANIDIISTPEIQSYYSRTLKECKKLLNSVYESGNIDGLDSQKNKIASLNKEVAKLKAEVKDSQNSQPTQKIEEVIVVAPEPVLAKDNSAELAQIKSHVEDLETILSTIIQKLEPDVK